MPPLKRILSPGIIAIIACTTLSVVGYLFIQFPKYLILPIESPSSYLPRGDWFSTAHATYEFPSSRDRYYIWRHETYVKTRKSDPQSPFDNTQSIFEYFDTRLEKDGWELYKTGYGDPCILYLPEARLLPTDSNGYVAYRKPDANSYSTSPTICLAVYSFSEDATDTYYYVVLMTVNPSTLTIWKNQFELGWK